MNYSFIINSDKSLWNFSTYLFLRMLDPHYRERSERCRPIFLSDFLIYLPFFFGFRSSTKNAKCA